MFAKSETPELVKALLGSILRGRRESVGRGLNEVAEEAGISPGHLSEVERGRKEISTERLIDLARALGIPVASIYGELARGLGEDQLPEAVARAQNPQAQLQLASQLLSASALKTVVDFSSALLRAETRSSEPIGFRIRKEET